MATMATPRLNRLPIAERGITIGDFLVPIQVGERLATRTRHVVLIIAGALFIALTANFSVPVPGSPVPITGQTLVSAAGRRGARLPTRRPRHDALPRPRLLPAGLRQPQHRGSPRSARSTAAASSSGRPAAISWASSSRRASSGAWLSSAGTGTCPGPRRPWSSATSRSTSSALPWLAVATGFTVADTIAKGLTPFLIGDLIKLILAGALFPLAWWIVGRRPGER